MSKLLFGVALLLITQISVGAYITDKLLAGYYASPDLATEPLRALPAGTPMEVLEEKGKFSRIRLGDNSEGWVESRFISQEKPAKTMLLELQAKYALLKRQAGSDDGGLPVDPGAAPRTRTETKPKEKPTQAKQRDSQPPRHRSGQGEAADREVQQLRRENTLLRDRIQQIQDNASNQAATEKQQPPWFLPLIMLGLLLSFVAGIAFKNYRIAKRAPYESGSGG